jgi:hypothetical protein
MRRFSRVVLWSGMAAALAVGSAPAQLLNELLRGAVNDQPTDLFVCDTGTVPCGLSYRYYSEVDASEINGPANPVDGIPRYAKGGFRYIADTQTTANFPVSQGAGGGNEWYLVWDGVTDIPRTVTSAGSADSPRSSTSAKSATA